MLSFHPETSAFRLVMECEVKSLGKLQLACELIERELFLCIEKSPEQFSAVLISTIFSYYHLPAEMSPSEYIARQFSK